MDALGPVPEIIDGQIAETLAIAGAGKGHDDSHGNAVTGRRALVIFVPLPNGTTASGCAFFCLTNRFHERDHAATPDLPAVGARASISFENFSAVASMPSVQRANRLSRGTNAATSSAGHVPRKSPMMRYL